jgi:hypothetical protein
VKGKEMYTLIIDGMDKSANRDFENFNDVLWWYNYALNNGASSAALWRDQVLIKFFIRGEK